MALICSSDFNKISKEWRYSEATAALSKTKTETKVEAIPTTRAAQTTESPTHFVQWIYPEISFSKIRSINK